MSTVLDPQTVESTGFTDYDEYEFEGDTETVIKKRKVVQGYRIKASLYHAAQYAGCARGSIYRWLERDPVFAQAIADAHEDCADIMETSVYERAFNDNLLAMFWMKAHRHKFRDKTTIDITVVQAEIEERMGKLGIRQLPPASQEWIDTEQVSNQVLNQAISSPSPASTKSTSDT
jgi:hypothetical protein